MRFIARSYKNLNRIEEARMWLKKAVNEAPYLRDPWVELGILEYENNNWNVAIHYLEEALKIKEHTKSYINEKFSWDHTPYDVISICYFNISKFKDSLENINKAINLDPQNERLLKNRELIKKAYNNTKSNN